ncbi:hypothetical protein JKP88DRAFT_346925 [Tribonema minus]|uniref:Ankyrin repeat domain containing protein n=1 Tax=Tribonema minus TaxID=303371 RepID=A0A835YQ93_9STRA|nr:hypothetical protein JKP88DRAFT_346925 [Tribonema minus]
MNLPTIHMPPLAAAAAAPASAAPDIWARIFALVGPAHFLQVAAVCRDWRAGYAAAHARHITATSRRAVTASATLLRWAFACGCPADSTTLAAAVARGALDVLQCALDSGCRLDAAACGAAARGGRLDALRWLRARGAPWDKRTCSSAARGGHLDVLAWARDHGCPWSSYMCCFAARGGHLRCLQWARAQGCAWNELTAAAAARGGSLSCCSGRARTGRRGMSRYTCANAAKGGFLDILKWAQPNGAPWNAAQCVSMAATAEVQMWILSNAGMLVAP